MDTTHLNRDVLFLNISLKKYCFLNLDEEMLEEEMESKALEANEEGDEEEEESDEEDGAKKSKKVRKKCQECHQQ